MPWLIKLQMMGNVDICGTEFRLGQKPNVSLSVQFLTCVSNRAKFFLPSFFSVLCAGSPRALYSLTKLSERRLSFLQSCGRTHKSRHPSFVTPLSPSSWHDPTLGFHSINASSEPADWPPNRLSNRWVRCALPLGPCAALSAWEGVRGTSF